MAELLPGGSDPIAFHARFRPDAIACVDLASGVSYTYRRLSADADACARGFVQRLGNARGARIVIVSRNSALLAVITLACDRAGAIFVPLNWRLTATELAVLLKDCEPALILRQEEFAATVEEAAQLAGCVAHRMPPEEVAHTPGPGETSEASGPTPAAFGEPSILLYTSGTTGRPKGVIITHENTLFSALNFIAVAKVTPDSVLLCDSPMFHTVGLIAITRSALFEGACVLISDRFVPSVTLARLSDPTLRITHYFVVPQMIEALLADPSFATADLSRMTALFSGGGPLSPHLVLQCKRRGVLLVNGFGMSEVGSAMHMPFDGDYMAKNAHSVGFAAPFIEFMLADEEGQAVAQGETGEIWVRGPSVSPGYWRQEEATRASRSGDWFRSGDLARQQEDGSYVIVDRLKDMYISGGENVYPAEVEAVLRQAPGVADAAVVGVADERWGEVGCAFVQAAPGAPDEQAIRSHCQGRLARFKQPAYIRFIDALPRTGSGKVRKDVLRKQFLKT
ncbi:MAG: AMP-binding protein [Hyphomonadaceae bacterium]|nr:AMP-binding protein [Hyphomonadaceae bacterium]